jgi:hypothetical protein
MRARTSELRDLLITVLDGTFAGTAANDSILVFGSTNVEAVGLGETTADKGAFEEVLIIELCDWVCRI